MRLHQYMITGLLEVKWLKDAFILEYLPRANKLYVASVKEWRDSSYKRHVNISDDMLRETIYETIRLGYIGLFHKYESFINGLVEEVDLYFSNLWSTDLSLEKYIKQEFDISISNNWKLSKTLNRINWICNSCKHYNGKPKQPKHPDFIDVPNDKKMTFKKQEYKKDCETIEKYCELMIKFVNTLAGYRLVNEKDSKDSFVIEPTSEMKELKSKHEVQIYKLVELVKMI